MATGIVQNITIADGHIIVIFPLGIEEYLLIGEIVTETIGGVDVPGIIKVDSLGVNPVVLVVGANPAVLAILAGLVAPLVLAVSPVVPVVGVNPVVLVVPAVLAVPAVNLVDPPIPMGGGD